MQNNMRCAYHTDSNAQMARPQGLFRIEERAQ
jgi:hypothetical protein